MGTQSLTGQEGSSVGNPRDLHLKNWYFTCYRNMSEKVAAILPDCRRKSESGSVFNKSFLRFMDLVITPKTVPDFTIPKSYGRTLSPQPLSFNEDSHCDFRRRAASDGSSLRTSSRLGVTSDWVRSSSTPCELEALSSTPPPGGRQFKRSHTISYDMIDEVPEGTTNADPGSRAAMTLPHLKTKTIFGFETLSERPQTRRKESLFHGGNLTVGPPNNRLKQNFMSQNIANTSDDALSVSSDIGSEDQRRRSSRRRSVAATVKPLGVSDSWGESSDGSLSMYGSPNCSRTSSIETTLSSDGAEKPQPNMSPSERRARFSKRRPASFNQEDLPPLLLSPEENFEMHKKKSLNGGQNLLRHEEMLQLYRLSALTSTRGTSNTSPLASEIFQNNDPTKMQYIGELKFKLNYDLSRSQLGVHILEGINLGGGRPLRPNPVNAFVKIKLSSKEQKSFTTCVVKQNNDPVFDQLFTFNNVLLEDLRFSRLSMKLVHREGLRKKNATLGEVTIELGELDFDLVTCHELIREVESVELPKELGRIEVTICFQPNKQKMKVSLLRIKDLPKHSITGSPDSNVMLELRQPGRPDVCLQSKIKKKATSDTLNDTFTFDISPRIEDLTYTCLSLTVFEREIIISDRVIGDVRFGFGATEESEFEHWNNVLITPGKEFTMWHMIMEEETMMAAL